MEERTKPFLVPGSVGKSMKVVKTSQIHKTALSWKVLISTFSVLNLLALTEKHSYTLLLSKTSRKSEHCTIIFARELRLVVHETYSNSNSMLSTQT